MSNKMNIISSAININQHQHQIVEKQPIQRSLAIPIHSPSSAQVSFRPSTSASSPIDIKPEHASSSMSIHNNHNQNQNQGGWNVKQVEEISPFFYVEKSHEVIKGQTASEIATNVCNFLKNNSIDTVYDDEEAVACAETSDHCKFRVHLFKPIQSNDSIVDDDDDNHDHDHDHGHDCSSEGILIEVQRRSGCCVKFHSIAMQILCAAKGCQYSEECPHYTNVVDVDVDSSRHHISSNCIGCDWVPVDIPSAGNVHLHETAY